MELGELVQGFLGTPTASAGSFVRLLSFVSVTSLAARVPGGRRRKRRIKSNKQNKTKINKLFIPWREATYILANLKKSTKRKDRLASGLQQDQGCNIPYQKNKNKNKNKKDNMIPPPSENGFGRKMGSYFLEGCKVESRMVSRHFWNSVTFACLNQSVFFSSFDPVSLGMKPTRRWLQGRRRVAESIFPRVKNTGW